MLWERSLRATIRRMARTPTAFPIGWSSSRSGRFGDHAVPARALRLVERRIRAADEALDIVGRAISGDADRDGDLAVEIPGRLVAQVVAGQRLAQLVGPA